MDESFNPQKFISELGEELVRDFKRSQGGTQSGAVGAAKEVAIRNKIENLLPGNVGVGSGFVIDSHGMTSRQCDLVIYEKSYALKFAINEDYQNTYFNCESVIAVGEVKSNVGTREIRDVLEKFERIVKLERRIENDCGTRQYNSPLTVINRDADKYNPKGNPLDRIFLFMVCNDIKVKFDTLLSIISEFREKEVMPNFLLSINGLSYLFVEPDPPYCLTYHPKRSYKLIKTDLESKGFGMLVHALTCHCYDGRTTRLSNEIYLIDSGTRFKIIERES